MWSQPCEEENWIRAWINVGTASQTLVQHWSKLGFKSHVRRQCILFCLIICAAWKIGTLDCLGENGTHRHRRHIVPVVHTAQIQKLNTKRYRNTVSTLGQRLRQKFDLSRESNDQYNWSDHAAVIFFQLNGHPFTRLVSDSVILFSFRNLANINVIFRESISNMICLVLYSRLESRLFAKPRGSYRFLKKQNVSAFLFQKYISIMKSSEHQNVYRDQNVVTWDVLMWSIRYATVSTRRHHMLYCQKAVSALLWSKQILPFGFAEHYATIAVFNILAVDLVTSIYNAFSVQIKNLWNKL